MQLSADDINQVYTVSKGILRIKINLNNICGSPGVENHCLKDNAIDKFVRL